MSRMHVFKGVRYQRGYGLGSVFASLFRTAAPLLKRGGLYLGKQALKTGTRTVQDILDGVPTKEALRKQMRVTKTNVKRDIGNKLVKIMKGKGQKRKREIKRLTSRKRARTVRQQKKKKKKTKERKKRGEDARPCELPQIDFFDI